jgi:hypothetical protein
MEKNKNTIPWKQGKQNTITGKFLLDFSAAEIFPLLCPVEEYHWYPAWECEMVFSNSGKAEQNAVFLTREPDGIEAVQTVITYTPPTVIEFLIVKGNDSVQRLSISLREIQKDLTELVWTSSCITYSENGHKKERDTNNITFQAFLDDRKKEMDYYLRNHEMLK